MHITGMTIGGIPPFTEPVEFEFDERVNVFVGPNASGKSTILLLMRLLRHSGSHYYLRFPVPPGVAAITVSDDWPQFSNASQEAVPEWGKLPYVEIAATRVGLPNAEPDYLKMLYLHRIPVMSDERTVASILEPEDALVHFSGATVERVINLMIEYTNPEGREMARSNLHSAIDISFSCAKHICTEIIQGDSADNLMIRMGDYKANDGMSIRTIDDNLREHNSHLPVHDLSSGVQSSLLWVRFLALKMLHHYEFTDGWEKRSGILLIDEIENHLHPTWQRRVIPALLEHFPGLQIFATTHSPFVVAGLKAGQVHMLKRDADGVVTASTNTEDIVGWTSDEILRNLMGVDDPTDDATAAAARELRRLRDEGPRDTEDAEAARQGRMQELRRLVDRDLLAGGPMAARRELFEQQFNEALEKYRQSQDLGQDSG